MLSFFNFLLEETNPPKTGDTPNAIGKVHEHLVHLFLGGQASQKDITQHEAHKNIIGALEYSHALVRAKHAADHIKKHIIKRKAVVGVERVSDSKTPEDPSDLDIHFANGEKVGVSLKATTEKKADDKSIKLSNPGLKSINSIHGQQIKKHRDPDQYLWNIGKRATSGFNQADKNAKAEYLKKHILRMPTEKKVYGVHTVGGTKPSTAIFNYHDHFTPLIKDADKIRARRSGNTINFYHPSKKTPVATLRMKWKLKKGTPNNPVGSISTTTLPPSFYKQ